MPSLLPRAITMKLKLVYSRITLNRLTTAFFLFSFFHCFAHGIIQSLLYTLDAEFHALAFGVVQNAGIPAKNITYLDGSTARLGHLHLLMCNDIPHGQPQYPCMDIFQSTVDDRNLNNLTTISLNWQNGLNITGVPNPTNASQIDGVHIVPLDGRPITLNQQCTQIMTFPEQTLRNFRREDLAFILLQFWLFAISIIAIVNDSVPHTLAVLATRVLVTAWSIYSIWRTQYYGAVFQELIADPQTPCSIDVFSMYFRSRIAYEIADLILNFSALFIACYLSWTLLGVYNAQSFKCVGAPEYIYRINKFFMAVLACLQLEVFVLLTATGLWIDVLLNTAIAKISEHSKVYNALFIATIVLALPWITLGWYAIRREMKVLMVVFLAISFIYTAGWAFMFWSIVYRWTFMQWPYLGCFTVASFVLLISTMVLGVVCRLNFGKGLAQYLRAEEALSSSNFSPEVFTHDEEKATLPLHSIKKSSIGHRRLASTTFYVPTLHSNSSFDSNEKVIEPPQTPHLAERRTLSSHGAVTYNLPHHVPF